MLCYNEHKLKKQRCPSLLFCFIMKMEKKLPARKKWKTLELYKQEVIKENQMPERQAILVVSFGTSYDESRKKTIDRIEERISAAYPQYALYRAWTSGMIRKKIEKRDGIHIPGVREAMEQMCRDGVREVIVQPTYVINGIENERMTADIRAFERQFERISIGKPLLTSAQDRECVIDIIAEVLKPAAEEALVLMGHGTERDANEVYAVLDDQFKDAGHQNIFMGTLKTYSAFDPLLRQIGKSGFRKIVLAPFMIAAGDHAANDLAGDEDSWKNALEKEGYEVRCVLRGLGEYAGIQKLFLKHLAQAMEWKESDDGNTDDRDQS